MDNLIFKLKQPWGALRLLRLALALIIMYDAYMGQTWWLMAIGGLFAYQAIANVGCAGGGCEVPAENKSLDQPDVEIEYEEVK